MFLHFILSFGRAIGFVLGNILDLCVFLSPRKDVPHPSDFMLHQMFVGVADLQPIDERKGSHIVIAVIYQGHLVLKITDVMFEASSGLHLYCEVFDVILKFLSRSVLVIEGLLHFFKTPECLRRK